MNKFMKFTLSSAILSLGLTGCGDKDISNEYLMEKHNSWLTLKSIDPKKPHQWSVSHVSASSILITDQEYLEANYSENDKIKLHLEYTYNLPEGKKYCAENTEFNVSELREIQDGVTCNKDNQVIVKDVFTTPSETKFKVKDYNEWEKNNKK